MSSVQTDDRLAKAIAAVCLAYCQQTGLMRASQRWAVISNKAASKAELTCPWLLHVLLCLLFCCPHIPSRQVLQVGLVLPWPVGDEAQCVTVAPEVPPDAILVHHLRQDMSGSWSNLEVTQWPQTESIMPDGEPEANKVSKVQAATCYSLQPQIRLLMKSALVTITRRCTVQQQLLAAQVSRPAASRPLSVQPLQEHTRCKQSAC